MFDRRMIVNRIPLGRNYARERPTNRRVGDLWILFWGPQAAGLQFAVACRDPISTFLKAWRQNAFGEPPNAAGERPALPDNTLLSATRLGRLSPQLLSPVAALQLRQR